MMPKLTRREVLAIAKEKGQVLKGKVRDIGNYFFISDAGVVPTMCLGQACYSSFQNGPGHLITPMFVVADNKIEKREQYEEYMKWLCKDSAFAPIIKTKLKAERVNEPIVFDCRFVPQAVMVAMCFARYRCEFPSIPQAWKRFRDLGVSPEMSLVLAHWFNFTEGDPDTFFFTNGRGNTNHQIMQWGYNFGPEEIRHFLNKTFSRDIAEKGKRVSDMQYNYLGLNSIFGGARATRYDGGGTRYTLHAPTGKQIERKNSGSWGKVTYAGYNVKDIDKFVADFIGRNDLDKAVKLKSGNAS